MKIFIEEFGMWGKHLENMDDVKPFLMDDLAYIHAKPVNDGSNATLLVYHPINSPTLLYIIRQSMSAHLLKGYVFKYTWYLVRLEDFSVMIENNPMNDGI